VNPAVVVGLLAREGRWFLQRRDPGSRLFPALWEFPGGKVEDGETLEGALVRELAEELRWEPASLEPLPPFRHAYPAVEVHIHPFLCRGGGHPVTELSWGWFTAREMEGLPLLEGSRPLVPRCR
jgi:8-oxo-dGTP diphosphatase